MRQPRVPEPTLSSLLKDTGDRAKVSYLPATDDSGDPMMWLNLGASISSRQPLLSTFPKSFIYDITPRQQRRRRLSRDFLSVEKIGLRTGMKSLSVAECTFGPFLQPSDRARIKMPSLVLVLCSRVEGVQTQDVTLEKRPALCANLGGILGAPKTESLTASPSPCPAPFLLDKAHVPNRP